MIDSMGLIGMLNLIVMRSNLHRRMVSRTVRRGRRRGRRGGHRWHLWIGVVSGVVFVAVCSSLVMIVKDWIV